MPGGAPLPRKVIDPEALLVKHLDLVERAALYACRKRRLGEAESEDFVSRVKVKLCEDDYEVIRRFQGRRGAKLSTYLLTVIERDFLDYLDHLYGKWRPSAAAKRMGPVAVELDRLLSRDGYSFDEACRILSGRRSEEVERRRLEEIAAQLPTRTGRPVEESEPLERLAARGRQPDDRVLDRERDAARRQILDLLHEVLRTLPAEDQLIVRMRCEVTVAQIARRLDLEQKPLYRRLQNIYASLRRALEERGVDQGQVAEVLGGDPPPEEGDAGGQAPSPPAASV